MTWNILMDWCQYHDTDLMIIMNNDTDKYGLAAYGHMNMTDVVELRRTHTEGMDSALALSSVK